MGGDLIKMSVLWKHSESTVYREGSFRAFPKSCFLILNSADMFPPWELKTFICRLEFLVRFQNQKRTIVSEQVGN